MVSRVFFFKIPPPYIFFSNHRLRGTPDVKDEMDDMRVEHEAIKSLPHVSFKDMIVNPALRSPLIIAMMMMLAQQLSGINCAIFYSTSIFRYFFKINSIKSYFGPFLANFFQIFYSN